MLTDLSDLRSREVISARFGRLRIEVFPCRIQIHDMEHFFEFRFPLVKRDSAVHVFVPVAEARDECAFHGASKMTPKVIPVSRRHHASGTKSQRATSFEEIFVRRSAVGLVCGIEICVRVESAHKDMENDHGYSEFHLMNVPLLPQK